MKKKKEYKEKIVINIANKVRTMMKKGSEMKILIEK